MGLRAPEATADALRMLRWSNSNRGLLTEPGREPRVGDTINHLCHVRQPHDGAIDVLDDQRPILRGLGHLPVHANGFSAVRPLEATRRLGDVGASDGGVDILRGQAGPRHTAEKGRIAWPSRGGAA